MLAEQYVCPAGHDGVQCPCAHVCPPGHAFPHAPQLLASVPGSTHVELQSCSPAPQVAGGCGDWGGVGAGEPLPDPPVDPLPEPPSAPPGVGLARVAGVPGVDAGPPPVGAPASDSPA